MDGILAIDKPQGMTSHDVVSVLRRKTGVKRIGHSGTLDPMATGVLPIFIGKATRVIEYASMPGDPAAKAYCCTMRLGLETDTQDIWGSIVSRQEDVLPSESEICAALEEFRGEISQYPPMYSAVKVQGRKLYEYARKGQEIPRESIKPRRAFINKIVIHQIDLSKREVAFEIECSKGVYVRTICADAGRMLGCGAVMSALVRTGSDGFRLSECACLENLKLPDMDMPPLLPMDAPLGWMPRADLAQEDARRFLNGLPVFVPEAARKPLLEADAPICVYGPGGFIGIATAKTGQLRPVKVFL